MKRLYLYIAACVIGSLICGLFYLRYFSDIQEKATSPDGHYDVFVRTSGSLSAMDSDLAYVQIAPKWHLERTLLFGISGDKTQIKVRWLNPNTLQIICHGCSQSHIDRQEHMWRDVVVNYEID